MIMRMNATFMKSILTTGGAVLETALGNAGYHVKLVTDDPLTFDWNFDASALTGATFTGSTPQLANTLTLLGPFQDDALENVYFKLLGVTFTNTGVTSEVVTGILFETAAPGTEGVLGILDDPISVPPGETLTFDLLIGTGQVGVESSVEDLAGV